MEYLLDDLNRGFDKSVRQARDYYEYWLGINNANAQYWVDYYHLLVAQYQCRIESLSQQYGNRNGVTDPSSAAIDLTQRVSTVESVEYVTNEPCAIEFDCSNAVELDIPYFDDTPEGYYLDPLVDVPFGESYGDLSSLFNDGAINTTTGKLNAVFEEQSHSTPNPVNDVGFVPYLTCSSHNWDFFWDSVDLSPILADTLPGNPNDIHGAIPAEVDASAIPHPRPHATQASNPGRCKATPTARRTFSLVTNISGRGLNLAMTTHSLQSCPNHNRITSRSPLQMATNKS